MVTWQVSGTAKPDQTSAGQTQNVGPKRWSSVPRVKPPIQGLGGWAQE